MLEHFFYLTIISGLSAAMFVLALHKLKIAMWLQMHGSSFISQLASCNFCMGFWINVLISIIITIFTGQLHYLLLPIPSAALTRATT